jgi:hypothetical protein
MSVIPLTIFFSLLLAGTFVVLFAREQRRRHLTSPERDSLLPLADETARPVGGARASSFAVATDDGPRGLNLRGTQVPPVDHEHVCGCRNGARPPCAGCLKRRDEQEPAYF